MQFENDSDELGYVRGVVKSCFDKWFAGGGPNELLPYYDYLKKKERDDVRIQKRIG